MAYDHSVVLVLALSFVVISMCSISHCHANDIVGSGTSGRHNPIAKVHVFGDLSSWSKSHLPNFNQPPRSQPFAAEVDVVLWCGPERIDVGRTEIYPSGLVDFAFNVLDGVLTDQSPQFGKCSVALTSYDTACSSQLQSVGGLDDLGSSVQQLLGGGDDHENNVPQYETVTTPTIGPLILGYN